MAATAATALVTLDAASVLELGDGQLVALVVLLAAVGLGEGLERIVGRRHRHSRLQQSRRVSETLKGLLVEVVDKSGVDWTSLGVHAFLVERRYRWFGPEQLRRIGRERIRSTPPPSRITWTKGKGVIGHCWELGQDVGMRLHPAHYDRARWEALPEDERMGLSYADYERTRQHRVVIATPILDREDRVIGIVSIDSVEPDFDRLWQDPIRDAMGSAATTLRNLYE